MTKTEVTKTLTATAFAFVLFIPPVFAVQNTDMRQVNFIGDDGKVWSVVFEEKCDTINTVNHQDCTGWWNIFNPRVLHVVSTNRTMEQQIDTCNHEYLHGRLWFDRFVMYWYSDQFDTSNDLFSWHHPYMKEYGIPQRPNCDQAVKVRWGQ